MKNFLIKIIFVILLVLESPFHAIALPKCSGDYDTVRWTDCFGVYEWSTGFQYSGEFKDGKRHGFGVSEFPNGTKYSGKYKFGSEDGEGISRLDLSLSIVTTGSFLFILSPGLTRTSITSTCLKSPISGTEIF